MTRLFVLTILLSIANNYNFALAEDPFSELDSTVLDSSRPAPLQQGFFSDNFTLKKELYSQFSYGPSLEQEDTEEQGDSLYSRQSAGLEVLKKFSTTNSTIASFDFQGRFVRRDDFVPVLNDEEGADREGWFFEYHNFYLDLYNILNPVLSDSQKGAATGHFNFRIGRFYLPFGLNLQTDTHGTVLQLSNERNFGFERDWYAGLWGSLNPDLNYDLYYLVGTGYDASFEGQDGLLGTRLSLSDYYSNEYGITGGLSTITGQRQSVHALERSSVVESEASDAKFIQTRRFGIDGRYAHLFLKGSLTWTSELSVGQDESEDVFTQLYQVDYLHNSRKWGLATQFRNFYQNFGAEDPAPNDDSDTSIIADITWYFRNDLGNTNLHWIKLNLEQQLEQIESEPGTITTLQYYRYW